MPSKSPETRLSIVENKIEGFEKDVNQVEGTIKEVSKSVVDAVDKLTEKIDFLSGEITKINLGRAKDKSFFAGMAFAYGTIGVLLGGGITAGVSYLLHKIS